MDDFIDAPGGDAQVTAQPGLAEPQGLHEFFQQYFSRMHRSQLFLGLHVIIL
jgi:hypothetical protein